MSYGSKTPKDVMSQVKKKPYSYLKIENSTNHSTTVGHYKSGRDGYRNQKPERRNRRIKKAARSKGFPSGIFFNKK